jgi:circadian clock protein KaiB
VSANSDSGAPALGPQDLRTLFEDATRDPETDRYILRLYVTGMTPRSVRAVKNLQAICNEYLKDRYDLEVVDIYQQPALARGEQIIAAPTLVKKSPLPMRRIVGDMSQRDRVLVGLDLLQVSEGDAHD